MQSVKRYSPFALLAALALVMSALFAPVAHAATPAVGATAQDLSQPLQAGDDYGDDQDDEERDDQRGGGTGQPGW